MSKTMSLFSITAQHKIPLDSQVHFGWVKHMCHVYNMIVVTPLTLSSSTKPETADTQRHHIPSQKRPDYSKGFVLLVVVVLLEFVHSQGSSWVFFCISQLVAQSTRSAIVHSHWSSSISHQWLSGNPRI